MPVVQTGRICNVVKTHLLVDERGICIRGEDGTPIIEAEYLFTHQGPQTLSKSCRSTDREPEVIKRELDVGNQIDEWQ